MPNLRRHLSFANVTAMAALIIATSGTSYAAAALAKNSVGTSHIKPGAVGTSDIHANAVTSTRVKNGSLLKRDFKAGQLPAGAKGDKGDQGDPGVVGSVVVRRTDVALPPGPAAGVPGPVTSGFATCAAGEKIIGGSANVSNVPSPPIAELLADRPSVDATGSGGVPANGAAFAYWKGTARALTDADVALRVFAICAVE